jgi:hypothetical protein
MINMIEIYCSTCIHTEGFADVHFSYRVDAWDSEPRQSTLEYEVDSDELAALYVCVDILNELPPGHGGRDRTRTCDLLRVKQVPAFHRFDVVDCFVLVG